MLEIFIFNIFESRKQKISEELKIEFICSIPIMHCSLNHSVRTDHEDFVKIQIPVQCVGVGSRFCTLLKLMYN